MRVRTYTCYPFVLKCHGDLYSHDDPKCHGDLYSHDDPTDLYGHDDPTAISVHKYDSDHP